MRINLAWLDSNVTEDHLFKLLETLNDSRVKVDEMMRRKR